jgi:alkanesulfonate monooxygenase SsuD/methylene tetrahydromethanopterin reductase-like flavin-dependent oxidoreductase (luciferase family)
MRHEMGITLHTGDMGMDDILRYAQEAESLGYEGFWLTEESGKEAFAVLAVLARATKRIRLATGIVNFYSRSPTLLAMGASTIHRLSGGRFALGLGSGGVGFMERGHGIKTERPLARARETVEIVRGLLTSKRFSYDGQWFTPRDFHLREGPVDGAIPLYLAALNPKMVGVASRVADGFIANWLTEESLQEYQGIIQREATAAGRDPKQVKILTLTMTCVDPNDEAAMTAMRRGLAFYCASEHYHHIAEISGFGRQAKEIKAVWETGDFKGASRMVTDVMCEKFGLAGSRDACRKRLRWMLDAGVYPIIYPLPRHDRMVEDHFATIRLAAEYAA